ncbi:MAG: dacB [Frankiales bacterium]|nr:dacB [Frankiales bacterium]
MRRLLVLPLAALLAVLGGGTAHAQSASTLRAQVEAALGGSTARSVGVAVDVDGLGAVDRRGSTAQLPPASTEKLLTAESALLLLGPTYRQHTDLRSAGTRYGALLRGDVYLVASGDPYFTSAQLDALARSFAATGITTVSGHLVVDDTRYDRARRGTGWKT